MVENKFTEFGKATLKVHSGPLFKQVKNLIIQRIESGKWPIDSRIPSENKIADELGVSRLTAHRALRELSSEGYLARFQGIGTFVALRKSESALLEIRPISEEIALRGGRHSCDIHLLSKEIASDELASYMNLPTNSPVYHSIIIHRENGLPIQSADRYVNPVIAPDYLQQDFTSITPSQYLFQRLTLAETEHVIESVLPDRQTRKLLEIEANEACLVVNRRTWDSNGLISTTVRLTHPGSRYRLAGRFRPPRSVQPL